MSAAAQSEIDNLFTAAREGSRASLGQLLTLYTVPVVYLMLDRLRLRISTFVRARRRVPQPHGKLSTT